MTHGAACARSTHLSWIQRVQEDGLRGARDPVRNAPPLRRPQMRILARVVFVMSFERGVMRRAVVAVLVGALVLVCVLFLGACGGDEKDAANASAASATAPRGEPI